MPTFIEATLNQIKNAWCQIAPQYYLNYQLESGGQSLGFSSAQITAGKFQFQAPGCPPPAIPTPPPPGVSDYPVGSQIDIPIYGNMPTGGTGTIDIFWGYQATVNNLLQPSEGSAYCNLSGPVSNPLGPTLDASTGVNFPVTAQIEVLAANSAFACGPRAQLRIKQRTGADKIYNILGDASTGSSGYAIGYIDAYIKIPGAVVPPVRPEPPPVVPGPTNNYNITWDGPTVQINSPITVKTGPVKINSDNEFYLTLNVSGGPDPYFKTPFNIQVNAKPVFKIGSDNNIKTEISFDIGPDHPEPPQIEPTPPFDFNGSWAQKICNIDGSEIITAVPYSGENFAGVQAAFTALSTVLGMWQDETIDCNPEDPEPALYSVPIDQWREQTPYRPQLGLWFWESRQAAIDAGRTTRCRRMMTIPVPNEAADPETFTDAEVLFWENYTWQTGSVQCTYKTRELSQTLRVNAINSGEGIRVITDILTRYGYTVDFTKYGRFSTGASPNMGQSVGGGYIQTTVKFVQASYSSQGANYAKRAPASVALRGTSKRGIGNDWNT